MSPRAGDDASQPAAPRQPEVAPCGRELVADPLVVRLGLVGLTACRGELAEPERRGRADHAADAHQVGEVAGVRRGAPQVTECQLGEDPGERERDPRAVVETVVVARTVHRAHGVGNTALRQGVAGMVHNTGGVVRSRIEHA